MLNFIHSSFKPNHRFVYHVEFDILILLQGQRFRHVGGSAESVSFTILLSFLVYHSEVETN